MSQDISGQSLFVGKKIEETNTIETKENAQVVISLRYIIENGRFVMSSAFVIGMLFIMVQISPQPFSVGRTINIKNDSVSSASKNSKIAGHDKFQLVDMFLPSFLNMIRTFICP